MNLIYIDESGNTGLNLKDTQQPIFLLAALVLNIRKWFKMEKKFHAIMKEFFGDEADLVELHAVDLKSRKGDCKGLSPSVSIEIRDRMLQLLLDYEIPVIYQRIIKSKYERFCEEHYGPGISINPYIMALPFICMSVNTYLKKKSPEEHGIFIFDEQQEYFSDAERSIRTLRLDPNSVLKTTNIVEKGFFVKSGKCFAL